MKRSIPFIAVTLLLSGAPARRLDNWQIIGPGGGGAQFVPTISPHNPSRVVTGCDMTGSYISDNAGESWRMFNLRDRARFFAFDPKDANTIYVGAGGLWRSADSGRTWKLLNPDPASIKATRMPDDHAEFELVLDGQQTGRFTAFAIDPERTSTLYAAGRALYTSHDGGRSWDKLADLSAPAQKISIEDGAVHVVGASYVTTCRLKACSSTKTPADFIDVAVSGPVIYAISTHDILISTDGGASWKTEQLSGSGATLQAIATSEQHPEIAYVSYKGLKLDDQQYIGVAKSVDMGKSWNLVWKESSVPSANIHDVWLSARFGPTWSDSPLSLGVAPTDPNIVYGTDFGRTMRSLDGGKTWTGVYSTAVSHEAFTTNGMDVTTAYGVHFDPFDRNHMFISYTDIGLFASEDGGKSWSSATVNGVPRRWVNTTYWMTFDPDVRGRVWAVMSSTHDLPRPKMWRRTGVQRYQGGVMTSDDAGRTWKVSSDGMEPAAATHILLDRRSPPTARTLYVAAFGRGVYKSIDGGRKWSPANEGLPATEPFAWRLAQDRDGVLYVVLARRSEDGNFGNSGDGAIYRSTDGAAHWTQVALPKGVNGPNGIAIEQDDPKRLYVAAWGRRSPDGAVDGGIWGSSDAGATWRNILSRDQHVYDVTIDPNDPKTVYACGFESSAWRSTDRGNTWTRIRGYNFKWGHRVIPDPVDRSKIYVTTFGGSVWHGPAAGDPTAPEDIATPQLAYSK